MKLDKKRILSVAIILAAVLAVLWGGYCNRAMRLSDMAVVSSGESSDKFSDSASDTDTAGLVGKTEGGFIDFESLQTGNQDIYAWITVPGTAVDYPVVQRMETEDVYDDYYLNHTVDFVEGYPGAIYSQPVNALGFTDAVTVLYGHNMKDGSMFGSLHEFRDKDFFDENRTVIIQTPNNTFTYEIFAEVSFSDDLIPYEYDFSKPEEIRRFLNDIKKCVGNFDESIAAKEEDRFLVLSKCFAEEESMRLLIVAVLEG